MGRVERDLEGVEGGVRDGSEITRDPKGHTYFPRHLSDKQETSGSDVDAYVAGLDRILKLKAASFFFALQDVSCVRFVRIVYFLRYADMRLYSLEC